MNPLPPDHPGSLEQSMLRFHAMAEADAQRLATHSDALTVRLRFALALLNGATIAAVLGLSGASPDFLGEIGVETEEIKVVLTMSTLGLVAAGLSILLHQKEVTEKASLAAGQTQKTSAVISQANDRSDVGAARVHKAWDEIRENYVRVAKFNAWPYRAQTLASSAWLAGVVTVVGAMLGWW